MEIDITPQVKKQLIEIKQKHSSLYTKIAIQLLIFKENSHHPSLRLHKLKGQLKDTWSISVGMDIRMIFYLRVKNGQKRAVFFAIGTHDEVYK